MNKGFCFILGAAIGSAVTYFGVKEFYERSYAEDIAECKEALKKKYSSEKQEEVTEVEEPKPETESVTKDKLDIMEYAKIVKAEKYINYSEATKVPEPEKKVKTYPYIIDEDEFGDDEHDVVTLTLYSDGVLARDFGSDAIVDDIEDLIGDALEHFGDDDVLYVRDDVIHIDYEIAKDVRTYAEVNG